MNKLTRCLVALASLAIATSVVADGRSDEDKARDAARKPAEVLAFLGLEKGDTVLDIWAAGGWYTEVFSEAVGPEGTVYAQNGPGILAYRDGYYGKLIGERLAGGRLANVVRVDQALADQPVEAGTVDLAFTALNLHDIHNRQGLDATVRFFEDAMTMLKPGGVMGVIEHAGDAGADNNSLHRMEADTARAAATAAGFVIEAESDQLANADDDHTLGVFDPDIRGKTDRFVLKLRKPE